jgi:predicted TIM-barrel enzyme
MDVLTTSGDGTGIAIDKDKLIKIKSSVGDKQMVAVASGITADNIDVIKDYCDIYMLRTAIIDKNDDVDIAALNAFVNKYTTL